MVYGFRLACGCCPVVFGQCLYGGPIRKQPGFKIVLCHMGVETIVEANSTSHLPLCILSILKIIRTCVDICQGNHVVGVRISNAEQGLDNSLQLLGFCRRIC